ncbi:MAG: succinylglutamate desuccinylase/aspartoacylase family protein [Pseudomonadota bacterium]
MKRRHCTLALMSQAVSVLLLIGLTVFSNYVSAETIRGDGKPSSDKTAGPNYQEKKLGEGERFETSYFIFKGIEPGPVVLIEAGIHGDEVAGTFVLEEMLDRLVVTRGTVILFPRMHRLAVEKRKRFLEVDLNHHFPGDPKSKVLEERIAAAIYKMVRKEQPDLVVTLHESRRHYKLHKKCCGHTIIYGVDEPPKRLSQTLEVVNGRASDELHRFDLLHYPVPTSSSEIFVRDFGLEAYCVETWLKDDIKARKAAHVNVVLAFLEVYGIDFELRPDDP